MAHFALMYTNNRPGLDPIIEADFFRTSGKFFEFLIDKEVVRTLKLDIVVQIKRLSADDVAAMNDDEEEDEDGDGDDETLGAVLVAEEVDQLDDLLASIGQSDQLDALMATMPGSEELDELLASMPGSESLDALIKSFDLPE